MGPTIMQVRRTQPKRVQPKRKNAVINYNESNSDDALSEDSEQSDTAPPPKVCYRVTATQKEKTDNHSQKLKTSKTISKKPLPKSKIFPFAQLPAELKNQIYEMALHDADGIYLVSKTKSYRRIVERDTPNFPNSNGNNTRRRRYRYYAGMNNVIPPVATPAELVPLAPNILLLNKETYAQGQPILYSSNDFIVEDTTALHHFLTNIGPKNCATLTSITVKAWGLSRAHKAMNHPAFAQLSNATNLQRLHIDCRISWGGAKFAARQLFRDGHNWFEAVGVAQGKVDAGVSIVEMDEENFEEYRGWRNQGQDKPSTEEQLESFRTELGKLLRARRH